MSEEEFVYYLGLLESCIKDGNVAAVESIKITLRQKYVGQLKRADDAERRVRWLEKELKNREYDTLCDRDEGYEGVYSCSACGSLELSKHLPECRVFFPDGTPKPTPENIK